MDLIQNFLIIILVVIYCSDLKQISIKMTFRPQNFSGAILYYLIKTFKNLKLKYLLKTNQKI